MTGKISAILSAKGSWVWSVAPDCTVYEALQIMADRGIGALLVLSEGRMAGIVTERDYARKVILQGRSSRETPVEEIMTRDPLTVNPDDTVDDCMVLMTRTRVRHLPVLDGGRVAGIVSIGDLVNAIISDQAQTIDHLHTYIAGTYPR